MIKNNKGFTLIELLVVIAIISILTTVILFAVRSAKNKATDKAIQENLLTVRVQANLYFDTLGQGSYGGSTPVMTPSTTNCEIVMFSADQTIALAISKIRSLAGLNNVACASNGLNFAVAAQLTDQSYFCVDSKSAAKINTGLGGLYDIFGSDTNAAISTQTALCH